MKTEKISQQDLGESNNSHIIKLSKNNYSHEQTLSENSHEQKQKKKFPTSHAIQFIIYALDSLGKILWKLVIEPKSIGEDKRRKEFLLNVILNTFLIFLFLLSNLFVYNGLDYTWKYKVISLSCLLLIWVAFISLLYLSRKGHIRTASYGLICLITLFSTAGALEWGFDLPAVIISYLLIIVISGILFDGHFVILTTLCLSIIIFLIGYYQINIKIPNLYWRLENPEMIDTITYSIELSFIMAISWLSNHEMKKSLARARFSEERLVNELERISQIYHFAEFGKLSSGAFHDLMNPLASISLNVNELKDSLHPDLKETKLSIKTAIKASRRMENFILALEKQIKLSAMLSDFSLNEEIEQAIELVSYKAKKAKCEILFKAEENIQTFGNNLAFYRTITNLLSNAIDSYEKIDKKDKNITVVLERKLNEILIHIEDDGAGIDPVILPKIFDPFFTTKSLYKGTGIGLLTSKERIEKEFGGTISVISSLNHGTKFTISVPQKHLSEVD